MHFGVKDCVEKGLLRAIVRSRPLERHESINVYRTAVQQRDHPILNSVECWSAEINLRVETDGVNVHATAYIRDDDDPELSVEDSELLSMELVPLSANVFY